MVIMMMMMVMIMIKGKVLDYDDIVNLLAAQMSLLTDVYSRSTGRNPEENLGSDCRFFCALGDGYTKLLRIWMLCSACGKKQKEENIFLRRSLLTHTGV